MKPESAGALFLFAALVHNLEESISLPGWAAASGLWENPVSPIAFTIAAGVLSAFFIVAAMAARLRGPQSLAMHVFGGCAVAMLANVIFPHVAASLLLGTYAPGTGTAILLVAPTGLLLLRSLYDHDCINLQRLWRVAAAVTAGLAGSIPVLFWLGTALSR